jgi:hypothetical protein
VGFFAGGAPTARRLARVAADEATRGARRNASRGRGRAGRGAPRGCEERRGEGACRPRRARSRWDASARACLMRRGRGRSLARGKEIRRAPGPIITSSRSVISVLKNRRSFTNFQDCVTTSGAP